MNTKNPSQKSPSDKNEPLAIRTLQEAVAYAFKEDYEAQKKRHKK